MSDKYSTRLLEYVFATMMLVWSAAVIWPGDVMSGVIFINFLRLAPEPLWGIVGIAISARRIYALILNGSWQPGPYNRMLGAAIGMNFWLVLFCLYTSAVWFDGAPDFPMRPVYLVFIAAEALCCIKCGRDHYFAQRRQAARSD